MIIKGSVQRNVNEAKRFTPRAVIEPGTARSAGQRLTYSATEAQYSLE